jgi:hypothetical protein
VPEVSSVIARTGADGARTFEDRIWSATHTPIPGPDGKTAYIVQHTQDVTAIQRLKEVAFGRGEMAMLQDDVLLRAGAAGAQNDDLRRLFMQAPSFMAVLRDILCEFARHGVRRVAIMDGHMENEAFITEAIELALRDLASHGVHDMTVLKFGHWHFITAETERALFPDGLPSWELEHAAVMETSVLLHLRPEQVRVDLIPDHAPAVFPRYDRYPTDTRPIPPSGALSSAAGASAEKGRVYVEQIVRDIVATLPHAFDSLMQEPA